MQIIVIPCRDHRGCLFHSSRKATAIAHMLAIQSFRLNPLHVFEASGQGLLESPFKRILSSFCPLSHYMLRFCTIVLGSGNLSAQGFLFMVQVSGVSMDLFQDASSIILRRTCRGSSRSQWKWLWCFALLGMSLLQEIDVAP